MDEDEKERKINLYARTIADIAKNAGWSVDKLREVLEYKERASPEDLAASIAAMDNVIRERTVKLEGKQQDIAELKADIERVEQGLISTLTENLKSNLTARADLLRRFKLPPNMREMKYGDGLDPESVGITKALAMIASDGRSVEEGEATIRRLETEGVIAFCRSEDGTPALFMAEEKAFASAEDAAIADRMVSYFEKNGTFDPKTGVISGRALGDRIKGDPINVRQWADLSGDELRKLSGDLNTSLKTVIATLEGMEQRGLLALKKLPDGVSAHILVKDFSALSPKEQATARAINRRFGGDSNGRIDLSKPVERPGEHTYMRAIESQYQAAAKMHDLASRTEVAGTMLFDNMSAADLYHSDAKLLRRADTFCWFPDPMHAVEAAAASLPTTVRITRDLTGGNTGWWFFSMPLDVITTDLTERKPPLAALLWAWDSRKKRTEFGDREEFGVIFSCYVWGDLDDYSGLLPTTRWFWPENTSLQSMMQMTGREYDEKYSEMKFGTPHNAYDVRRLDRGKTLIACEHVTRFFAAGCLWVQQKILSYSASPVQRHWRKRAEKEHKPARPLSDVQIIQLRRRQSVVAQPGEAHPRDWKCRWIVSGHWRNQFYPSKGKHEEIWIDSYDKGPEDKPLKVPAHRVYAVSR
jgi:hypothetical protein